MEITVRDLWTVVHGMGFGALFMLAFSGAFAELYRITAPGAPVVRRDERLLIVYLVVMVLLSWLTVLSGAYLVYPWYRATPPAGTTELAAYPRSLLLSSTSTSEWHRLGMEWKEHVAWIAPIAMTMVAYVYAKYRACLYRHRALHRSVLLFMLAAFIATGIAGLFGAFINKYAPTRGGATIQLLKGE